MVRPSTTTGDNFSPLFASRWLSRAALRRCSLMFGFRMKSHQFILASPSRVARLVNIERNDAQQIIVIHFRQQLLTALVEQIAGQAGLPLDECIDFLFNRTTAYELVDEHIALLPDAEGAVGCLILHCRIPPSVEVNDMRGRREVQPGAAGLERENEKRRPVLALEIVYQSATF